MVGVTSASSTTSRNSETSIMSTSVTSISSTSETSTGSIGPGRSGPFQVVGGSTQPPGTGSIPGVKPPLCAGRGGITCTTVQCTR